MEVIFIRHAEPDYSCIDKNENFNRFKNFIGLSENGRQEANEIVNNIELEKSELIISSPYTRALETAQIISKEMNIPVKIEFDLREWDHEVAKQYNMEEFNELIKEMARNEGVHSNNCKFQWEDLNNLGERALNVIKKYQNHKKIIIITHFMVINQFIYKENIKNCEIIKFNFNEQVKPLGFHIE